MADPAVRQLDQLPTDRRACCLALVACPGSRAARRRVAYPPTRPLEGEGLMGWVSLLLLIAASLGLLRALGARGGLLTASAAALLLGATGYALQGSPNLPGARAAAGQGHNIFPLADARHPFFRYFTPAASWLPMSDALWRDGPSEN